MKYFIARTFFTMLSVTLLLQFTGCEKLLNEPSDRSLVIPTTLDDLQALLDNSTYTTSGYGAAGEEASDDYYLTDQDYQSLASSFDQNRYRWHEKDNFDYGILSGNSWSSTYQGIYAANSVLEALPDIPGSATPTGLDIRGQAYFWRAYRLMNAAEIWTLPYDDSRADIDPGLPLRMDTDFNQPSQRSTLRETYDQIIVDLQHAAQLLPVVPLNAVRASRPAAYAALARLFLHMRQYEQARLYADSCLQLKSNLLDYNQLDASINFPFQLLNEEVILHAWAAGVTVNNNIARISSGLLDTYNPGDLRRTLFYQENTDRSVRFRGGYGAANNIFRGLSSNEIWLIRAEGHARRGDTENALNDLNTLLSTRWDTAVSYTPHTGGTTAEVLDLILKERRKELPMRGLRWTDIRRLNKEGAGITQTRTINGNVYTLSPNDLRYALPIPESVLEFSGIQQNAR